MLNKTKSQQTAHDANTAYLPVINPEKLEIAVIALAQKQLYNTWVASFVTPVITMMVFWNITPRIMLFSWATFHYFMLFIRVLHTRQCPINTQNINEARSWKRNFIILQCFGACSWGIMPFVLMHDAGIIYISYITALIFVSSAVVIPSYGLILPAYYANCIITILPLSLYFYSYGERFYTIISMACIFLIFLLILIVRTINKSMLETLKLRFENLNLIVRLKKEKEKAEKANHDKSQFLAAASHDLRQPLHSLGLFLGSMENYIDNADAKLLLDKSNRSLGSLKELFDSLLDISKLDAGTIDINKKHFFLSSLLEKMETEFQRQAEDKQLEFNINFGNQTLYTDPVLLLRCLRNFISNAIKHTDSGKIVIDCHEHDEQYRIEIRDTGTGIPESQFENIFDEFHQLENPERDRRKGLGLGLAIVKHLSILLDHKVGVDSILGKGSCFYIIVPKGNADNVITQEVLFNIESHNQSTSILIIDDEMDVLEATSSMLKQWRHNVEAVDSIENAIHILENGFIPDFIITDYRLRDNINGIDAIEKINQYLSKKIPSIIITGDTSPERIKEVNATDHILIHKPVIPIVLRNAINHLISSNLN